jgi:hypothetical protein
MLNLNHFSQKIHIANNALLLLCTELKLLYVKLLRFQVLTAASMKLAVFWSVVPCGLVKVDQHFRGARCRHHHRPDDGGSKHL